MKEEDKLQIMSIINQFYEELSEKITKTYDQELFSVFDHMPSPIINYNDVGLLKKAQLYVRHTDRVFNNSIAKLVQALFEQKKIKAEICQDRSGKCVFVSPIKTRFHFVSIEKFAGFPHVPWIKDLAETGMKGEGENNIYIVLIKTDKVGTDYLNTINSYSKATEKKFFTFESFIVTLFDEEYWEQIDTVLKKIQKHAEELQWFELARIANPRNILDFSDGLKEDVKNFDYYTELSKTSVIIDDESFAVIGNRFINDNLYLKLFDQCDFSKSFQTSEWLYKNHMKNDLLDKTYVAAGYLKSVEQLLFAVIENTGANHTIGITSPTGIIDINVDSPEIIKATLGNMVHFLKDANNLDIYHDGISSLAISGISIIINKWVQSERNGYFHKHNISNLEKVEEIRDNTFLLYYLILGSLE